MKDPTSAEIYFELFKIIAQIASVDTESLDTQTRIVHDLDINGDDFVHLMLMIEEKFDTRLEDLEFYKFTVPDSNPIFYMYLIPWIRRKYYMSRSPISIQHLHNVIQKGSWFDPLGISTGDAGGCAFVNLAMKDRKLIDRTSIILTAGFAVIVSLIIFLINTFFKSGF